LLEFRLTPKALRRLHYGAHWFWPSDLAANSALPGHASPLLLLEPRGKVAASALWDAASAAPIRVYSHTKQEFSESFVLTRWREALAWRSKTIPTNCDAFRLAHSEGDRMPGLVADRYGTHVSFAPSMANWHGHLSALLEEIQQYWSIQSASLQAPSRAEAILGVLPCRVPYLLNGHRFQANPADGQKTGAFLDQRENYLALQRWLGCLSERNFGLDLYCANGGFARHMAESVTHVEAVDRGETVLESLGLMLEEEAVKNIKVIRADVREYLQGKAQARRTYDAIVVDPPAFAKSRKERQPAMSQYADINARALRLTKRGSLYVSCSCSHHISAEDLLAAIREAALSNEKTLQILEQRGQSVDHPILLNAPETEYLKCFFFRVI
jgi:23S rRNA (cytosine1962-C5)-methyltransferase